MLHVIAVVVVVIAKHHRACYFYDRHRRRRRCFWPLGSGLFAFTGLAWSGLALINYGKTVLARPASQPTSPSIDPSIYLSSTSLDVCSATNEMNVLKRIFDQQIEAMLCHIASPLNRSEPGRVEWGCRPIRWIDRCDLYAIMRQQLAD